MTYDPRQQPRSVPPQDAWGPRQPPPQWQPQPPPPQYPPQWQQPVPYRQPQVAVTRKPISFAEHIFHFLMCFPTCGLWIFVWIARAAGKRKETTYYR